LLRHADWKVQYEVARAIGGLGAAVAKPEVLAALRALLRDAEWHVRSVAASAISQLAKEDLRVFQVRDRFEARSVAELSQRETEND
jgi:HEAT repeat protein